MAINWPWKKKETKRVRGYAGASVGRLTGDWVSSGTSADTEIKSSLKLVRNRSRQLIRDNDYAKSAIRNIANNVVGQGFGFQSQVKQLRGNKLDTNVNDLIENEWYKWSKKQNCHVAGTLSFNGIERLVMESVAADGEIFVRIIKQPMGDSKIPMALEIIEADLLDENHNEKLGNGNTVKMGVERNEWGRPVAYHFFAAHPGDDGFQSIKNRTSQKIRIPADEIEHLYFQNRASQSRGMPWLASSILRMHHLHGYEEAEVISSRATASLMGFIESPDGEIPFDDVVDADRVSNFEPGVFKHLAPGEKVNVPSLGRPGGQFDPFVRAMLRGVAAGFGVSYESLSRDYSQGSYSSARQALIEDRDNYRVIQSWLKENFHERIYNKWLELAVLSGAVNLKGYENNPDFYHKARWMPRGWTWIDPQKEVQAYKDAVRCGFSTLSDVVSQSGGDIEELMAARALELQNAEDLDLVFDTDPSEVDGTGKLIQEMPEPNDQQDTGDQNSSEKMIKNLGDMIKNIKPADVSVRVDPSPAPVVNVTIEKTGKVKKTVERDEKTGLITNIIETEDNT